MNTYIYDYLYLYLYIYTISIYLSIYLSIYIYIYIYMSTCPYKRSSRSLYCFVEGMTRETAPGQQLYIGPASFVIPVAGADGRRKLELRSRNHVSLDYYYIHIHTSSSLDRETHTYTYIHIPSIAKPRPASSLLRAAEAAPLPGGKYGSKYSSKYSSDSHVLPVVYFVLPRLRLCQVASRARARTHTHTHAWMRCSAIVIGE
jgi:hypothetical protein